MILRKIVARNRWETAWVHEGVCVTSAVCDGDIEREDVP